ncbi:PAS domain-containing sensor histidine kinase [Hydrogenophaga sp. RAC07]|uniref:PAS domain-containing sensor histidine kinase n=1 Tax=Hydrogenophaga sp. RAC07 TaxID=1842537 RepID=UPI001560C832|nr:PAS domain S-box protein [Hydrogenophaga sp. RAC07]
MTSSAPHAKTLRPSVSPEALAEPRLAHAALEGVITVDQQQRIVMINPAGLSMFGLTREQALGMDLARLIPQRLREAHADHVRQFGASGETERAMGQRGRVMGVRASGEEFPLEAAIFKSEVAQPSGNQTYYTALLRDLSELSRMSSVIEQLNQRLRALFERAPVAIWITERDRVVFANQACAQLIGLPDPAHLIGRSIFEVLSPPSHEQVRSKLRDIERDEGVSMVVGSIQHADGSVRDVELVVAVLPDHERSFVQMVINDITQRSREKKDLLRSRRTLRELSASLVEAREEERRRIARELHDELGQRLTALKLEMIACQRDHPDLAVGERAQLMLDMLDETVASARRIAMDLRPLMLDDLGLPEAIDWLVQEFKRRTGIEVDTRLGEGLRELPPPLATTLYRIVQEALTNITRHARATRVSIGLQGRDHELLLTIQDNGVGFARGFRSHGQGSFGLLGIRERVLMLGGRLSVGNVPEGGARLVVHVPLAQPPAPAEDDFDKDAGEPLFDDSTRGHLD